MSDETPILEIKVVADEGSGAGSSSSQRPPEAGAANVAGMVQQSVATADAVRNAGAATGNLPNQTQAASAPQVPQAHTNPNDPGLNQPPSGSAPSAVALPEPKLSLELLQYRSRKHDYIMTQWQKARARDTHFDFDIEEHGRRFDEINVDRWAKSAKGAPSGLLDVVEGFGQGDRMQLVSESFEKMINRFVERAQSERPTPRPDNNTHSRPGPDFRTSMMSVSQPMVDAAKSTANFAIASAMTGHPLSLGSLASYGATSSVMSMMSRGMIAGGSLAGLAGGVAGVGLAATAGYGAYKVGVNQTEELIDKGIVPTTKAFAKMLPFLHDYINILEATDRRFQADMQKFGGLSPALSQAAITQDWMLQRQRWTLLGSTQGVGAPGTLQDKLLERQRLGFRFQSVNDRIEAALSNAIYKQLNPHLETIVRLMEFSTPALIRFIEKAGISIDAMESFGKGLIKALPDGGVLGGIKGIFRAAEWMLWTQQMKEKRELIKQMKEMEKNNILGNLGAILYGEDEQDPDTRDQNRRRGPQLPRGKPNGGKKPNLPGGFFN